MTGFSHRQHRFRLTGAAVLLASLFPASLLLASAAEAIQIMPHRATYDLKLSKTVANSAVTQASGHFEFEWGDACTGWTVLHRTRLEVVYANGRGLDFGASHRSWEAKDGKSYEFFIRRTYGDGRPEEVRGKARIDEAGAGGVARFSHPEAREVQLPKGVVFPTWHSLELLDAAERSALPLWRVVFDGSGDDGYFGISAALVRELEPGIDLSPLAKILEAETSWRMQLAFFDMSDVNGAPEQEQGLRVFANGVVDELELDYGDFTVKATLSELTRLGPPDC